MLPEDLEHRWGDYFSGLETSPYCDGSAVSLPFRVGTLLEANPECAPGSGEPPLDGGLLDAPVAEGQAADSGFP
jgi:hypothetical protein